MARLMLAVEAYRVTRGITAGDMARRLGVSRATYYRMADGRPVEGATLASVLGWLLQDDDAVTAAKGEG